MTGPIEKDIVIRCGFEASAGRICAGECAEDRFLGTFHIVISLFAVNDAVLLSTHSGPGEARLIDLTACVGFIETFVHIEARLFTCGSVEQLPRIRVLAVEGHVVVLK